MDKLSIAHKSIVHNLTLSSPNLAGIINKQQPITLEIGSLIGNVEGNLDRTVLPDIQRMIDDSFGKLSRQFNKIGISKRV